MTLLTLAPVRMPRDPNAPITPADLLDMEGAGLYELVEGRLVEKPMGYLANKVGAKVSSRLVAYSEAGGGGDVLQEQSFQCFPHDDDLVRRPDVAFIAAARVPACLPRGHVRFAPDLAVEVISPTNTVLEMDEKLADYWSAGVPMVWIVNPDARLVRVHRPRQPILEYSGDDVLLGDPVLPGFAVAVREFWPAAVPSP